MRSRGRVPCSSLVSTFSSKNFVRSAFSFGDCEVQSGKESCMKQIGLILATLIGIVAFTLLANRATRIPSTRAAKTNQENRTASAPDFTLKDLEDHDVSLSQFKGKVVLVNFWATW